MLSELTIKNFAIIDELVMTFDPGLNVLTGETGAGKSIIIDAVGLLLGGRAERVFIRAGCDVALVEGVFLLDDALHAVVDPMLKGEALDGTGKSDLVLCRELRPNGRNVCRVNGRTVNLNLLRMIGRALVDMHGQSEHLSLLQVRQHLLLLDRYAGLTYQRDSFAGIVSELHHVRAEMEKLTQNESAASRSVDLLRFQINEVISAQLQPGEDDLLQEERTRLANAAKICELTVKAIQAASEGVEYEGGTQLSAADLLGDISQVLDRLAQIDVSLVDKQQLARLLAEQVAELGRDLQDYQEKIEFNPMRLVQVEERLDLIHNLKRKYGNSISDVISHCEQTQHELDQKRLAEERIADLREQENELLKSIGEVGSTLSQARRHAGIRLAQEVMIELDDLRMESAQFKVDIGWQDDDHGAFLSDNRRVAFDKTGLDRIEFLVAPNPGEGLKPIVKIASGGETSRLMLALKGVLAQADETPTLIFDEIDQGIGGRVGSIVGHKLWRLTGTHQVLCITHLPQLAGYGNVHFRVSKHVEGDRTRTLVSQLDVKDRIDELAEMLGAAGVITRQGAGEILEKVAQEKNALVNA